MEDPTDLKNLNIRTIDNKYHQLFWSSIGAIPNNIAFSDLFYAVQQGVVNDQENTPKATVSVGLQKLHPYIILTNHLPFINAVVMNKEAFDNLSQDDQLVICRVFQEYCQSMQPILSNSELESYFLYVSFPSNSLQEAMMQGVPAVKQELSEDLGADITEQFYSIIEESA